MYHDLKGEGDIVIFCFASFGLSGLVFIIEGSGGLNQDASVKSHVPSSRDEVVLNFLAFEFSMPYASF